MNVYTLYDFGNSNLFSNPFMYIWVIQLTAGSIFFAVASLKENLKPILRYTFTIFGCLIYGLGAVFSFFSANGLANYDTSEYVYKNNLCKIVEGEVSNFNQMPEISYKFESFTLGSVYFKYSDYFSSESGFSNMKINGGPIREGKYLRVYYYNNGIDNIILKIERITSKESN